MIMTMHTQPTEFCVHDFPVLLFHWGAADTKYNSRRNYDILLWNEICKLWKLTQKDYVNSRVLPVPLSAWLLELVPWIFHSGALTCSCPVGIASLIPPQRIHTKIVGELLLSIPTITGFGDVALTRILPGKADCQSAFCTGNSADLHPCSACSWTWQTKKTNKQETHCRWEMRTAPYTFFILFYYLSLLFLSICTISSNEPGFSLTILQLDSAVSQEKNCFHLKKLFLYNSYCSNIV